MINAGGGRVTAVCTVTHGYSDDGTLCGLGFPCQTTLGTGGGVSGYLATGILEGKWKRYSVPFPKVLRTFSGSVLNDDVIEPPFLGYMLSWML